MTTESRAKERTSFQEVAKLANQPEPPEESSESKNENSGMIDFAALAAGQTAKTEARNETNRAAPSASPAVARSHPPPREPAFGSAQPVPAMFASVEATLVRPASSAMPIMGLPFGSSSPTLPGVGQPGKLPTPRPAPPTKSLPPPMAPPLSNRAGIVDAEPAVLPPPPALPPETTRPTTVTAAREQPKGSGAVWVALGGGIGLGALMTAVFLQAGSTHAIQATGAAQNAPLGMSTGLASPETERALPGPNPNPSDKTEQPGVAVPGTGPSETQRIAEHSVAAGPAQVSEHSSPPSPVPPAAANPTTSQADRATTSATRVPSKPSGPAAADQSLEALMKRAVGIGAQPAPAPPPTLAAAGEAPGTTPGNLPLKPAIGAVQGAVGTVLPATRYCLGPDDPISHATISFKADGTPDNVVVTGPAAGQPAEACIRSRLMTARVPPFSNPTFTWTITVRPAN